MNTSNTCPKCGTTLPADAPEGLCPTCLMQGGFATDATIRLTPSQQPSPSQPAPTPLPEELAPLFPQLEIIELLGRGGMGTVYKARQPKLNRFVALKIISAEAGPDPHFAERFQREAQALAKLNHPHIVSVFDFGESNGLFYFLMEFVDGANLRTLIRSGEMKPEAALALIPAFCDALQYAHDEGVVHRDIKPENVLVDKKGRVKIADFGLAKLLGHDSHDHTLTRTGMSLGTPRYMAPEQMDKPETVDHRADIYSLGVVFYEMLTGEIPMGRFAPPSHKVQVDIRFDEIVLHAMERDVELRYQHVSEVKTAVEKVTSKPLAAPVTSSMSPVQLTEPIDPPEQLSRYALWGATLAVPGIAAWCMLLRTIVIETSSEGAWMAGGGKWETGQVATFPGGAPLFAVMIVVGLGALCAATFLGRTAIAQIKGSGGKLYGLPLAAFARMLIPLLVIGTVALALTHIVQIVIWTITHTGYSYEAGQRTNVIAPSPASRPIMTFICFDLIVALSACFFAARSAWRKIVGRPPSSPKAEVDVGVKIRHAAIGLLLAGILDAFAGLIWIGASVSALSDALEHGAPLGWLVVKLLLSLCSIAVVYYTIGSALFLLHRNDDGNITFPLVMAALSPPGCIFGLPAAIYALVLLSKPEVKALFPQAEPEPETAAPQRTFRREAWWFSRSSGVQKLMGIVLGAVLVISLIAFLSFSMTTTTTADHSGVVRNLHDFTVGAGDPWLYLLHHKTGTRGGFESGMNLIAGSALFGYAALCAGLALTRLTREHKRRSALADASADAPQQKFFWNAVASVALFIASVAGVIVHEIRNDNNGGLLADAVHEVHPDFTRPGITSIALKKAIADELQLTPEQLEKIDASLNRAYLDFLKLENEHSLYRSENGHLVKIIKPFPDRSFDLAQRLATELRGIAGKPILDAPERNAVWKLRLFRHAGEFNVRAELWEKDGNFHREETWERDGKKITGGRSGDTLNDLRLAFGHYLVDWEAEKDIIHEPQPDDATTSYTLGPDVIPFVVERIRNGELARRLAVKEPDTVVKSGNPHAALVTQAGTSLGRACAETELQRHGIPFAKDATPEQLVTKLEALLGANPTP